MRKRNESISEIRTEFEACRGSRAELYEMYAYDTRMGVQKLIQKYQKQDEKLANERLRLKQMRQYEESIVIVTISAELMRLEEDHWQGRLWQRR